MKVSESQIINSANMIFPALLTYGYIACRTMKPEDERRFPGENLSFSALFSFVFSVLMLNYFILIKWNYRNDLNVITKPL